MGNVHKQGCCACAEKKPLTGTPGGRHPSVPHSSTGCQRLSLTPPTPLHPSTLPHLQTAHLSKHLADLWRRREVPGAAEHVAPHIVAPIGGRQAVLHELCKADGPAAHLRARHGGGEGRSVGSFCDHTHTHTHVQAACPTACCGGDSLHGERMSLKGACARASSGDLSVAPRTAALLRESEHCSENRSIAPRTAGLRSGSEHCNSSNELAARQYHGKAHRQGNDMVFEWGHAP
eukprot:356106-Chlamydomonas_euryale.AAC.3